MNAIFYNFAKRKNSTELPNTDGTPIDILLKDSTSILAPVIELRVEGNPSYSYCYIPEFTRYYFIDDWNYNEGIWSCKLVVDVLSTYRGTIEDYTCFVERSASFYDADINDELLSAKQKLVKVDARNEIAGFDTDGCYIIRLASTASILAPTGVEMFAISASTLGHLLSYLYDSSNFSDVLAETFVKAIFNPIDYIISIKWFPFSADSLNGIETDIWVGWWNTGIRGYMLPKYGGTIILKVEPMERYYNDWRDCNPNFTTFSLYIPSYGIVAIPPEHMYFDGGLDILCSIDYSTGQFVTFVNTGASGELDKGCNLTTAVGMVGYDVQIGQTVSNIGGIIQSAVSLGGSVATGNVMGGIASGVNAIKNAITPVVKTLGSTGAIQGLRNRPWFTISRTVYGSAEYPTAVAGRPLMQNVQLGTLSGFVKCGGASISIDGLANERDTLNMLLNSGFYME